MRHKPLTPANCSVARSLERVGEWWSILILRDAIAGKKRFHEFQEHLGVPPNILARRLDRLVATGVMERRVYCARPPRYEYVLTRQGRDFSRVVDALRDWDIQNFRIADSVSTNVTAAEDKAPQQPDDRAEPTK